MTICSAPGKLFLGGEYAVLHGAPAVVTAVNRRAVAQTTRSDSPSKVVAAARHRVRANLQSAPTEIPNVRVDSPRFRIRGQKVGLGSSAACCAAASGVIFEWAGLPIETHRDKILEIAVTAHRDVQGGKGSGGDVAVAVMGGTIVFTTDGRIERVDTPPAHMVSVWTGRPASTTQLLAQIDAFKTRDGPAHKMCFEDLAVAADGLAKAYLSNDVEKVISQTRAYGAAMGRLGERSGTPIVTSEHKLIENLARDLGGGAKPSGAGGGDVGIAVFPIAEAASAFRTTCRRFDLAPLDLDFHADGLRRDGQDKDPNIT